MRLLSVSLVCAGLMLGVGAASGATVSRLDSTTFTRGTGKPKLEGVDFQTGAGDFVLTITSPAPGSDVPVTSASVWLDGELLAGSKAFKSTGTALSFTSTGAGSHRVEVELEGKPGATLAVAVTQVVPCFEDDFSTNPWTNGRWRDFYQDVRGPGDALVWDEAQGQLALTKGSSSFGSSWGFNGMLWADYELPGSGWTAELDYWVGGGTAPGGLSPSDGLLISFHGEPVTGGVNGYFVFLDNFRNGWDPDTGFVGLYHIDGTPSPSNLPERLDWVDDGRGRDGQWHHLKLDVLDGRIRVYIDDMSNPILDHTVSDFDGSRSGFGLMGMTRTDDILVDDVSICPR